MEELVSDTTRAFDLHLKSLLFEQQMNKEVLMTKAANAVPEGYHTITPQLTLDNAAQGIDWYKKALGADEVSRSVGPDGKIMHAELKIGDSRFMVNDVVMDAKGPKSLGGSPAGLWLFVENSDALFNRAVAAGGKVKAPMDNQFWGDRAGAVADPAGYTWWIATRKEDFTPAELKQRAAEFYKQMAPASR
ncbi:MAG: VOC family protein [Thermoanaerobaculia bacterium]